MLQSVGALAVPGDVQPLPLLIPRHRRPVRPRSPRSGRPPGRCTRRRRL